MLARGRRRGQRILDGARGNGVAREGMRDRCAGDVVRQL